jgi:trans-aconitate methyltransferase
MTENPWRQFLDGFAFPYGFFSAEEYREFLFEAGLTPLRVELFPKDMKHAGIEGLVGWIRTTWLPYTERLPVESRELFVKEIACRYLKKHPTGVDGMVHVDMMQLEIEACKP